MLTHMAPPETKDFVLPKFPYMVCAKGGERIYNLGGKEPCRSSPPDFLSKILYAGWGYIWMKRRIWFNHNSTWTEKNYICLTDFFLLFLRWVVLYILHATICERLVANYRVISWIHNDKRSGPNVPILAETITIWHRARGQYNLASSSRPSLCHSPRLHLHTAIRKSTTKPQKPGQAQSSPPWLAAQEIQLFTSTW